MKLINHLLFTLFFLLSSLYANTTQTQPKLILQITVDQLRGDLLDKYAKHMGEDGFKYLTNHGIWYKSAYFTHSITQTAVGHTTLATGADPSIHGVVANRWFDRERQETIYSLQDKSHHKLSYSSKNKSSFKQNGRSPKNILVSTFSDELALFTNKKAKIFAVSVKDRGAITLAGHTGKAFWFSKKSGKFITSSYYYNNYPEWAKRYNKNRKNNLYDNKSWEPLLDISQYIYPDAKEGEVNYRDFGTTFPHKYGSVKDKYFNTRLALSPVGDELTLEFTKVLFQAENLGKDSVTDFLAISFSTTDYVGHTFSPSSVEAEDNLLRLDRTLANLFEFIDKEVGLENTLIVLSADHGAPESSSNFHSCKIDSQHLNIIEFQEFASKLKQLDIDMQLISSLNPPYIYLNHKYIKEKGFNLAKIRKEIASKLLKLDGVEVAITIEDMQKNSNSFLITSALKNYHPRNSGDILIVNKPHYIINSTKKNLSINHGSPWRYDRYVPIIFAGFHIKGQKVYREVEPTAIAPTLSAIVGAKAPSGSVDYPLDEVLKEEF